MDIDGYISYEISPTYIENNIFIACAQRFLKLLLCDRYGSLLRDIRANKMGAQVSTRVSNTDKEMKRLTGVHPDSIYSVYRSYKIKNLDINTATSDIILEIELTFVGGATTLITL